MVPDSSSLSPGIYRAMLEVNGRPKLGNSASTLGVRLGTDIEADSNNLVHPPAYVPHGKNGLSCAPAISLLPRFILPVKWGGTNKKTEVWRIDEQDLGSDLVAKQDAPDHISIGPATSMTYDEFTAAIGATASRWVKVT